MGASPRTAASPGARARGFTLLEGALILNSLLAVAFLYAGARRSPRAAHPLLWTATALFLAGAVLASASNHRVDLGILPWHAAWHVVGAFGFVILWGYNHARFGAGRNR